MITDAIIGIIILMLGAVFAILPVVNIQSIPYAGTAIYNTLVTMMGIWNAFLVTFPYALVAWHMLLYIVLPFELLLLLVKFFLGSRAPVSHN